MRYILPIFTAGMLVLAMIVGQGSSAQNETAKQVAPVDARRIAGRDIVGAEAQALLQNALSLLDDRPSVAARIRCQAQLHDRSILGTGTYLQGAPHSGMLRWEMTLRIDQDTVSLQQIADGRSLWPKRDIDGTAAIERVDLTQVPADRPVRMPVLSLPPAGGLPEMLRGLDRAFEFSVAIPVRLGSREVFAVRGNWRPAALAKLLPGQETTDLARLPVHVPDHVVVFLGQDDLFPYRIDYLRQHGREGKSDTSPATSLLALEWYDVRFDDRLNPTMFAFDPGESHIVDRTSRFIEMVRRWP